MKNMSQLILLDTIDSTNEYAKREYQNFDQNKLICIAASKQTHGKGRFQRKWFSPDEKNIYATFYKRLRSQDLHYNIGQILAFSTLKAVQSINISLQIKWPNDLLFHKKKIGGILTETIFETPFIHCFIGIGLNVNMSEKTLSSLDIEATSLKMIAEKNIDPINLLKKIQKQFEEDLEIFEKEGFKFFKNKIEKHLAYVDQEITIKEADNYHHGKILSLTDQGMLKFYDLKTKQMLILRSGDLSMKID
ncbi:MAG TPA: biotin--[acetyl-CoA-carboxylase] ligase [Chlamydiales bacterium]|nr:biotin--[acetyl-CoA-carboxylase] ligase [Chlamydiales bacterium]